MFKIQLFKCSNYLRFSTLKTLKLFYTPTFLGAGNLLSLLALPGFLAAAKPPPKIPERAQTCRSIRAKKQCVT